MIRLLLLLPVLGALWLAALTPAAATEAVLTRAGAPVSWRYNAPNRTLPFPRSEREQSIRDADACRDDCGAHCTWGVAACLVHDAQGHCIKLGDTCDRYCQRECRTMGGPFVTDIFDAWE